LAASSAAALYAGKKTPERATPALDAIAEGMERQTWNQKPKTEARKEAPPEEATPAPTAPNAAALFASANEARRTGRTREALRMYRELERRYPDSPEAKLSHAIVGRMLLDEDPNAALGEFDRYLGEGKGTLSEEALVGRALSLQKLGRDAEERAAWEALLRTYPNSIHAARARARLAALGGG
jgi:tetratricopeptide (TPR) repeat protein